MRILVKIASRERPEKLKECLRTAMSLQTTEDVKYIVSLDSDDPTIISYCEWLDRNEIEFVLGTSNNKIHACNRDIPKEGWDILVLLSDDMFCKHEGWDRDISLRFEGMYPDTDGCLWYEDGYQDRICTLSIMGKKYYDRFGYIYHPDYHSLWCDNEHTDVATALQKMTRVKFCIFEHKHPANNPNIISDKLYDRNEKYYNLDQEVYERRKATNFEA